MALRTVDDTNLVALADAIRAKTGTAKNIEFPNDFIQKINNMISRSMAEFEKTEAVKAFSILMMENQSTTDIVIPEGAYYIGDRAFSTFRSLKTITIPETIEYINSEAFYDCFSLQTVKFPSSLKQIENNAFVNCYSLSSVTFEGTPTGTLSKTSFVNCSNLQVINVPWAQGAVANAPWGATNATINYNYTG